jgi:molybdopterin synthase sulfur carrier subunit
MNLELRFFATFRAVVGTKTVEREFPDGATIGDVLYAIEEEYPDLAGEIVEDGAVRGQVNVLKNGREIVHLDGLATTLADGDAVSVFPPVAGGAP